MDRMIEDIGLSVRAYAVLKREGFNYESEIKKLDYKGITSVKNIHRKVVEEIEEVLGIQFE